MGVQENVVSFDLLGRVYDWAPEKMEALPQLPDSLVWSVFKNPLEKI
jgi:hypothetical protein